MFTRKILHEELITRVLDIPLPTSAYSMPVKSACEKHLVTAKESIERIEELSLGTWRYELEGGENLSIGSSRSFYIHAGLSADFLRKMGLLKNSKVLQLWKYGSDEKDTVLKMSLGCRHCLQAFVGRFLYHLRGEPSPFLVLPEVIFRIQTMKAPTFQMNNFQPGPYPYQPGPFPTGPAHTGTPDGK